MNTAQQAPVAEQAATPSPAQPASTTLEERATKVLAELRGEPSDASEAAADAALPSSQEASAAASGDPDKARAERKARLAALQQQDRERVDQKQRQAAADKHAREAEQARKEAADLKAMLESRIDPSKLTEADFFRLAEQSKIPPSKLAEWMREAIANPEKAAAAAAAADVRKAVDPEVAALKAKIAQLEQFVDADQKQRQAAASKEEENSAARDFFRLTEQNAATHSYSAAFLQKKGPEEYYRLAHAAASSVPPGAGLEVVLDLVEERLADFAAVYGHTAPSSQGKAPPQVRAAAKANTVSNQLAATRASVVEESDLAGLSLDERAARLIKQLG